MSDQHDPLLRALGALDRERERRYPAPWEDVLAGRASAEATAAARAGVDPPEEHAVFRAVFTGPIADTEVDALVERLAAAASTQPALGERAAPASAVVIPLRRRRIVALAAVAIAIAAALMLWRFTAPPRGELVAYDLTMLDRGVQPVRGDPPSTGVTQYNLDSTIHWALTPMHAVVGAVELRVVADDLAGHGRVLAPPTTRSDAGALRLRGRVGELLPLETGRWRLRLLVSRPGAAPERLDAVDAALADGTAVLAGVLEVELLPVRSGG